MSGSTRSNESARRSEIVAWESAAWALTGAAWIVAAWPGLLVSWEGWAIVPVVAIGALAALIAWQIVRLAPRPTPSRCEPKPRRAMATAITIDGVLWAGSGIAWCVAARQFNWSERFTAAPIQMGLGFALLAWAVLGFAASNRIDASSDNPVVVARRSLGTGPMTVAQHSSTTTDSRI